jgi:putative transposase
VPRLGKPAVAAAARRLGLGIARVYGVLRVFRNHPVTAALLPAKSGPAKGARQLNPAIEARIEAAIDAIYLTPQRPTLSGSSGRCGRSA